MKRSPLKRTTPLARQSAKRTQLMRRRREFNKQLEGKVCEIRSPVCNGRAESWHEHLKRSAGGSITPDAKADRQGQKFSACCLPCNGYIEDHAAEALAKGWSFSRFASHVDRSLPVADQGEK